MNAKRTIWSIVIVAAIIVGLFVGILYFFGKDLRLIKPQLHLVVGAEYTLKGTVLENVTIESQSDGPAYLFLLTDSGVKVKIVYSPGMAMCRNYETARIGFHTKAGDKIEVRGKALSANELFTCESDDYYITLLGSSAENTATSTTANWQLYRNEQYGFEVKYPQKYYLVPPSAGENSIILLYNLDKGDKTWTGRIALLIQETSSSIFDLNLKNAEQVKIGFYDALKLGGDGSPTQVGYIIIFRGKEYNFAIDGINSKAKEDMQQILSTVKFIK